MESVLNTGRFKRRWYEITTLSAVVSQRDTFGVDRPQAGSVFWGDRRKRTSTPLGSQRCETRRKKWGAKRYIGIDLPARRDCRLFWRCPSTCRVGGDRRQNQKASPTSYSLTIAPAKVWLARPATLSPRAFDQHRANRHRQRQGVWFISHRDGRSRLTQPAFRRPGPGEIKNLDGAVGLDPLVAQPEVAMRDALLVGGANGVSYTHVGIPSKCSRTSDV